MPIIFDSKDSVFFVGGRGTKTGNTAATGCTKAFWGGLKNPNKTLADVMGANGDVLSSVLASLGNTSCDVIEGADYGSGTVVRITKTAQGYFPNCVAGLLAGVSFAATYVSGFYEILGSDTADDDWIDIDESYSANTTCGTYVGGAFPGLQIASDNTDANSTTPHNVDILTNKAETRAAATAIDIDVGGGDANQSTWKRIIGVDDDGVELANGAWVIIDGNGYATHCFNIEYIGNICFRHIYAYNTGGVFAGFNFTYTVSRYGFLLEECKATNHAYGVKTVGTGSPIRNFMVIGGIYSGSTAALYIENTIGGSIHGIDAYSAGVYVLYLTHYGLSVQSSIIRSDGTGSGIYIHSTNAAVVRDCIIYNVTIGIYVAHANATLIEYNNIFMVAAKATGKAINRTAGGIAYSDYSCLWALDGAPEAADRWGGIGKPEHAIEQDPQFVDAANGDFRLELSSPCLHTGRPTLGQL